MVLPEELTDRQSGQPQQQELPPRKAMQISKPSQLDYLGCHHQHRVQAVTSKASGNIQLEPLRPSKMPSMADLLPPHCCHSHGSHSSYT